MVSLIARRYVKALLLNTDKVSILEINKELQQISLAYKDCKFNAVITSFDINKDDKVKFILSLNDTNSASVSNLIKLLGENKRLDILPYISEELNRQIGEMNNDYNGTIYTNKGLDTQDIKSLEEQFGRKFNVNLSLNQTICDYDGIKVELDGLGVEISFSKSRLRTQMIEHILKAI